MVSVLTTQLSSYSMKAVDNTSVNEHACVPIKLFTKLGNHLYLVCEP